MFLLFPLERDPQNSVFVYENSLLFLLHCYRSCNDRSKTQKFPAKRRMQLPRTEQYKVRDCPFCSSSLSNNNVRRLDQLLWLFIVTLTLWPSVVNKDPPKTAAKTTKKAHFRSCYYMLLKQGSWEGRRFNYVLRNMNGWTSGLPSRKENKLLRSIVVFFLLFS